MATLAGHSGGELEELRDEVNKFKEESEKVRRLCYLLSDHSYLTFIFCIGGHGRRIDYSSVFSSAQQP